MTREQANYIYKKVETGKMINTDTIKQEIELEEQLNRIDDTNGEINPYWEIIVNNAERIDPLMTQMEQWSILSNVLNYVQHDKHYVINHSLHIKTANKHKNKLDIRKEEEPVELDFCSAPLKLCEEYLDVHEGIQLEIVNTTRFNENSDLSMTYLSRSNRARYDKMKTEESFPISEHGYTSGRLLDGTEYQLLLDINARKSFMSKVFYTQCRSLHSLPRFTSKTQRIQVGNGQCVSILFIILVIIDVHGHRFEIYTLVSEIHANVDLVLGIKNEFELEGVINSRDCCFKFVNRSLLIFPEHNIILKPNKQKLIKVNAPFIDKISGLALIKILDKGTHSTLLLKLKFMQNKAV